MTTHRSLSVDVAVIGGGLAGVSAALAAARNGARVALVQNRPVLGGNSSSEVRVWVCGATATGHQRFARETGIIGELYLENEYRNPLGNPYYWDLVLLDAVKAEERLTLLLNTHITEVEARDGRIDRVRGVTIGSEIDVDLSAQVFVDATGDGVIAALAGAETRLGREARGDFDEPLAPEVADDTTLGSTLLFYTRRAAQDVPFVPPAFAIDITQTSIPESRILRTGDNGADYWWIEWGGELDIVTENERIRDELWAVIYGIWDYIKNSGRFADAGDLTLEWVGAVPGKREYRRVTGGYTMTQRDITEHTEKPDAVGFGGWSVDLHPPRGVYEPASAARQTYPPGTYDIPFGILRAKGIENLLLAGRDVSASHIAFGSLRVMATCAVMGEAAGTAAAMCAELGVTPEALHTERIGELQQRLIRQDASMIGVRDVNEANLALRAEVHASSSLAWSDLREPDDDEALSSDLAQLVPGGQRGRPEVFLSTDASSEVTWSVHRTRDGRTYFPDTVLASGTVQLAAGHRGWVELPLHLPDTPADGPALVVVLDANPDVRWGISDDAVFGMLAMRRRDDVRSRDIDAHLVTGDSNEVVVWDVKKLNRRRLALRFPGAVTGYEPAAAVSGYARPFGGPRVWSSAPLDAASPETLTLEWDEEQLVSEVRVVLNDDVHEYLNNLHYVVKPFRVIPELVADFDLEVLTGGAWNVAAEIRENRRRHLIVPLAPVRTSAIRLVFHRTNGARFVQVCQVRVY